MKEKILGWWFKAHPKFHGDPFDSVLLYRGARFDRRKGEYVAEVIKKMVEDHDIRTLSPDDQLTLNNDYLFEYEFLLC